MLEAAADALALQTVEKRPAAATIASGFSEALRSPRTSAPPPGTARSTTGARSTSKPKRPSIAPTAAPARRVVPAAAVFRKEGVGATRSRNRSTGPPS
jgi:hypothetical protein